jgi:hypothetical protein
VLHPPPPSPPQNETMYNISQDPDELIFMTHQSTNKYFIDPKFPLAPMGVLAPRLRTLYGSASPPIDTSGNFLAHLSAESLSNISPTTLNFQKQT